jgi:hypothetical protein
MRNIMYYRMCVCVQFIVVIQSDQQETKSRVLPHLLFYRNVRRILIRHFYIIAVHSFCWLPTSQKSIIKGDRYWRSVSVLPPL